MWCMEPGLQRDKLQNIGTRPLRKTGFGTPVV